jgi:hypothetical protein
MVIVMENRTNGRSSNEKWDLWVGSQPVGWKPNTWRCVWWFGLGVRSEDYLLNNSLRKIQLFEVIIEYNDIVSFILLTGTRSSWTPIWREFRYKMIETRYHISLILLLCTSLISLSHLQFHTHTNGCFLWYIRLITRVLAGSFLSIITELKFVWVLFLHCQNGVIPNKINCMTALYVYLQRIAPPNATSKIDQCILCVLLAKGVIQRGCQSQYQEKSS